MAGTQSPKVKIAQPVAVGLDEFPDSRLDFPVGVHVEQDAAGVADQAVGPAGDDERADDPGERVHPQPAKGPGQQQPDDDIVTKPFAINAIATRIRDLIEL